MTTQLSNLIDLLRTKIEAQRAELAVNEAAFKALNEVQSRMGAALPAKVKRRGRQSKGNGIELTQHPNSAAAKDATLATYTSS